MIWISLSIVVLLIYSGITAIIAKREDNHPDLEDYSFAAPAALFAMMFLPFTIAIFIAWGMGEGWSKAILAREKKIRKLEQEKYKANYRAVELANRIKQLEQELDIH
jgi:hypothetical protein